MELISIIIFVILILSGLQLAYSYISIEKFACPACPECKPISNCSGMNPPSSYEIVRHIHDKIISQLELSNDGVLFLSNHVIFANNIRIKFETDAEGVLIKMRQQLIDSKVNINVNNINYIQINDPEKLNEFKQLFNINEYPTPLISFKDTDLLFGWINSDYKWKILIDKDKY